MFKRVKINQIPAHISSNSRIVYCTCFKTLCFSAVCSLQLITLLAWYDAPLIYHIT